MAEADHHDNHGQSVAAWTAVGILMVASVVMSWAVVISSSPLFVGGAVLALVGIIVGKVLAMAGFGVKKAVDSSPEARPGRSQVDSGIS